MKTVLSYKDHIMKLLLLDGYSLINRAFYGLPPMTNGDGLHTNGILGFFNILFKLLEEEKPDYLAVALDVHAPTFRHLMFAEYKGTRKPMPEDLREQLPLLREMLHSMGIAVLEKEGLEADDILGTLAKRGAAEGMGGSEEGEGRNRRSRPKQGRSRSSRKK